MPQDILITPNRGSTTSGAQIAFTGYSGVTTIYLKVLPDSTLSFEGSAGQLLSISDNLTSGTIFSVSDITGIPSIDVDANGLVRLVPFGGNVALGTTATSGKLQINTGLQDTIGLIVQSASGQTANYTEWRNVSGTIFARVNASGEFFGLLASGIVGSGAIASGSIGRFHLSSGAVNSGHIGNAAVTSGSIASGQIGQMHLSSGAVNSGQIGNNAVVSGSIASGQISQFHIASGVLTTVLLGSGQVVSGNIGNGAVVSGSIASGQIGANHLASGVLAGASAAGSSGQVQFNNGGVFGGAAGLTYSVTSGTPNLTAQAQTAWNTVTTVKAISGQVSNLQEWQSASGSVMSYIDAGGRAIFGEMFGSGNSYTARFISNPANHLNGQILISQLGTDAGGGGRNRLTLGVNTSAQGFLQTYVNTIGSTTNLWLQPDGGNVGVATTTVSGRFQVNTASGLRVGLVVQGFTSQTANLTEWQNNTGVVLAAVDANGRFLAQASGNNGGFTFMNDGGSDTGMFSSGDGSLYFNTNGNRIVTLGTHPTVTGNSLTVSTAGVSSADSFRVITGANTNFISDWLGNVGVNTANASGRLHVEVGSATRIGVIVRGFTSQTANLQEWQNSANSIFASINASGSLYVNSGDIFVNQMTIGKGPGQNEYNTVVGYFALASGSPNTDQNVAIGRASLSKLSSGGTSNVAVGNSALDALINGGNNTAIGTYALGYMSSGGYNTAVGRNAGAFLSGSSNQMSGATQGVYLGGLAQGFAVNETNALVVGYNAQGHGSNTTVIGNTSTVSGTIYGSINFPFGVRVGTGGYGIYSGGVFSGILSAGTVTSGTISSGAIGQMHLSSGAVNSGHIGNNAVVSGSIASGQIFTFHIVNGGLLSGAIGSGQIGQAHLASGAVISGDIGNAAVVSGSIASGQIGQMHLSSGAVNSGQIANNAVVSGSIASGQIFTFHIVNGGLLSGAIGSGQIGNAHLASGAVISGDIGNAAVVSGSIASGQVSNFHLASGAVGVAGASGELQFNNGGVLGATTGIGYRSGTAHLNITTQNQAIAALKINQASGQATNPVIIANSSGSNNAFLISPNGTVYPSYTIYGGNNVFMGAEPSTATVASGFLRSVIIGAGANTYSGNLGECVAVGYAATAGRYGVAIGQGAAAQGITAGAGTIAIGLNAVVNGTTSIGIGTTTNIAHSNAIGLGSRATSTANGDIIFATETNNPTIRTQRFDASNNISYLMAGASTWIDSAAVTKTSRFTLSTYYTTTAQEAIRIDSASDLARVAVGGAIIQSGRLSLYTGAAGNKGLIIQGFTSQAANFFEIQNSAASPLMLFNNSGNLGIGVLGSGATRLHVVGERVLNSGAISEWPAGKPDGQTQWRNPVIISDGGNGTLATTGTGTTCGIVLGEYYTGRIVIQPQGGGSTVPADQGTGNGRDMMLMGGSSDNTAGKTGGRLFLQGGAGYPSTGYSGNYGITAIQPVGGNAVIGAATNLSGRFQINIGSGTLVGQVIRSFTSQTANLTEWQNTAGYPIAYVNASGSLYIASGDAFVNGMTIGKGVGQIATNTAIGYQALNANTTGSGTVAVGYQAGASQTGKGLNAYLGFQAGFTSQSGAFNVGIGAMALYSNLGNNNVAVGYQAMYSNTSGTSNVAVGNGALFSGIYGFNNTAIGHNSLAAAAEGFNTAVGFETFHALVSGNQNVAIGYQAGHYTSGGSNLLTIAANTVFVGGSARGFANTESGSIAIGWRATTHGSRTTVIGNTDTVSGTIHGNINFPDGMRMAGYSNPNSMSRISGNVNDYVFDTRSSIQKILSNGSYNITGISYSSGLLAHEDGKFMRLFNGNGSGGFNITLVHNSASSAAGNKFWCVQTQDIVLGPYDYAELTYDTGDFSGASGGAGWRVH